MRNRAKCKLCGNIIESLHPHDWQQCKCGEIFVDGGEDCHRCGARDWNNFLRVDDDGNEVVPVILNKYEEDEKCDLKPIEDDQKHDLLLQHLKGMIDGFENLPGHARTSFVTQMDLHYALLTIYELFKRTK